MIAHRLTTIKCADNLLYFESPSVLVSASKGSLIYDQIFEKLKAISYAYGEDSSSESSDENMDDIVDLSPE